MARKDPRPEVNRRKFLAGVAVAGAATAVTPPVANGATPATLPNCGAAAAAIGAPAQYARGGGRDRNAEGVAADRRRRRLGLHGRRDQDARHQILPSNCASSFRAIHESLINYGGNKMPEYLTCTHEESAVGMAHGYFKIAGKPLMTLCHGTVGLQHATMGIYNAWCDRCR
jgi:hypothetical protein